MASSKESTESAAYAALGASSAKGGVLKAVGEHSTSRYFATPIADPFGDPTQSFFLHADGAGTKSIVAYLLYRETGDIKWFRSLATDSLVMNLDDIACSGALSGLVLSNTIGRNRRLVPDEAISEIIAGYKECAATLNSFGIEITLSGGETADMGDLVRTLVVDSTLSARIPSDELVDTYRVEPGDAIVAFSNVGQVAWETAPNSGIGSNGLSLARNVLLSRYHVERYPEAGDPEIPHDVAYRGPYKASDFVAELGTSVGAALLSPTRSYAPLIKTALRELRTAIHSLIHCTGGGQVKIKRFGRGVRFEKTDLFPIPPLFDLIQRHGAIPWPEMYSVFNMGHRLEASLDPAASSAIIARAAQLGIAARIIGRVSSTGGENEVVIASPHGEFTY